ncbi:DUF4397 domain-containing protein [Gynurincola endophyticus]|uniref:DUF4397 domain-containing protein n=1 Tax=Gynurincola endophyticus TaxID=2479004 RepID=UPI000F8C7DF4|nr:DUF4397 domain-containing protein [Gynurincola endophyticus]
MNKRNHFNKFLGLIVLAVALSSCQKDKFDMTTDNRMITDNMKNSNVRIINLGGFNQVVANGDSVTSFYIVHPQTPQASFSPGTQYFPKNGRLGSTWTVPQQLFDNQEKVELKILDRNYYKQAERDEIIQAENDYHNPVDYYLMVASNWQEGQPQSVKVPRGITAPAKPDHFKIRILNLSARIKGNFANSSGSMEELHGNITLAYADGTAVHTSTTSITAANPVSEYIEVPYGTYQFKILTDDGRQIPSAQYEPMGYAYSMIDPPTSTVATSLRTTSNLVFAPLMTYEPGGIYTIVVTPQRFNYYISDIGEDAFLYQNSFSIINDNSTEVNMTYCRIQGVNAFNNDEVNFKVNGHTIGNQVSFGHASEYTAVVQGDYTIEATDASGKVIATTHHVLRASMNYSFWLYPSSNGNAQILTVSNDLSGKNYIGAIDDATYGHFKYTFFSSLRFLNMSPDNSYITFTKNNGQPMSHTVASNLQPALPVYDKPYLITTYPGSEYEIMVYRSAPDVIPGTWASDITPVSSEDIITRKELYTNLNRALPAQDIGVYTIALIGRNNSSVPARIMILKHNK